jgi:lysophospholipase L1-like esterase
MTGKRALFAAAAVVLSLMAGVGLLWAADLYLHKKFEAVAGLNIHGYRGPLVGRKQPGEQRVVVLGGSTALGYGVPPAESFPALLEQRLNARPGAGRVRLINLAYNTEGAHAYLYNLRYYERLQYDVALLYTGFNDLAGGNRYVYRNTSPIFKLTGYMPILPLIFQEKAMALRHGGDIEGAYRGQKTVFKPNLAQRTAASALEGAVRVTQSLEQQLGRFAADRPEQVLPEFPECGGWGVYCESVYRAVRHVRDRGRQALVISEPHLHDAQITEGQVAQQEALRAMLRAHFGGDPRVHYLDFGRVVDLGDPAMAFDGLHLTAAGNQRVAEALAEPLARILQPEPAT